MIVLHFHCLNIQHTFHLTYQYTRPHPSSRIIFVHERTVTIVMSCVCTMSSTRAAVSCKGRRASPRANLRDRQTHTHTHTHKNRSGRFRTWDLKYWISMRWLTLLLTDTWVKKLMIIAKVYLFGLLFFLPCLYNQTASQTHAHFNHNMVKPKFASREAISMMAD